jgi:hypothetical protein
MLADKAGNAFVLLRRPDVILPVGVAARDGGRPIRPLFADATASLVDAVLVDSSSGYALGYPSGEILRWRPGDSARQFSPLTTLDSGSATIAGAGGVVAVARVDRERGLVMSVARGDSIIRSEGVLGDVVARTPRAASLFGKVSLAAAESTVVAMSDLSDFAYLFDIGTARVDSIRIARTQRRGARDDLARLIFVADSASSPESLLEPSSTATSMLSRDGMLLTVYRDHEMRGSWLGAKAYLHVTNLRTREQCGDIPIPGAVFPLRRFAFAGKQLLSIQPETTERRAEARRMTVLRLDMHLDRCDWEGNVPSG